MQFLLLFIVNIACLRGQSSYADPLSSKSQIPQISIADLKQYRDLESLNEKNAPKKKDSTLSPYFYIPSEDANKESFPLKDTNVDVTISGVIADVNIKQQYKNEGTSTIEAVYVFPLSTKAAVYSMTMTIGDRRIEAEVKRKDEARKEYELAKSQGRTASLLEQKRPNVFEMNVANILPGDDIVVDLRYTELLVPREQTYEFVFPTVVGPRFTTTPDTPQNSSENWSKNPYLEQGSSSPSKVSINVDINAPFPIKMAKSPSHQIDGEFSSKDEAHFSLPNAKQNKDFILQYKLAGEEVSSGLLTYEGQDENYFLAMIEPPAAPKTSDLLPREYIYIVDVSGSMRGFPLSVSKAIIGTMLNTMRPQDYFNILFFAGGNQVLSEKSLPVTAENISTAQNWLSSQHGGGGTQLLPAMKRSLELPKTKGTSRTIAVVTDGYVTVEKETFELIKEKLGEANMFTYGIGSSVNRYIIEGMSRAGRGESFIVTSPDDALVEGTRFANYILNPILTDIDIQFDGIDAYDVSPLVQPDLFTSRPIIVYGKYKGKAKGSLTITGTTAGDQYTKELSFAKADKSRKHSALAQLWARNKIYELDDLNKIHPNNNRIEEVTELGLKYNLMTQYTSFVATDKVKRADGNYETVKQPSELPEGVGNFALPMGSLDAGEGARGLGGLGAMGYGGGGTSSGLGIIGTKGNQSTSGMGKAKEGVARKRSSSPLLAAESPTILGSLDKSLIDAVIKRNLNQIRYCYERELTKSPDLSGKIVVKFVVNADGTVSKATIDSTTMNSPAVENCISRRFLRFRFPQPKGGGIVIIKYPFVFNSK